MRYIDITALSIAVLLFSYAAATSARQSLGQGAGSMLATVGVSLAITPNPYNSVAAQLSTKQKQLDQREAQIAAQEQAGSGLLSSNKLSLYSLGTSLALFILVATHFYFDMKRRRPAQSTGRFSIDLR